MLYCEFGGVKISYKHILLLILIFILSISAVSATELDNHDSDILSAESPVNINDLDDNLYDSNPLAEGSGDSSILSDDDSPSEDSSGDGSTTDGDATGGDGSDNTDDDSGDDPTINPDDNPDEPENITLNTTLKLISNPNLTIYGNTTNYYVELVDENNMTVEHANITFKIKKPNGKYIYKYALTNGSGIAKILLNFNERGIYNIEMSFNGNSEFSPADNISSKVTLYHKTVIKTPKQYAYRSCNFTIKLMSTKGELLKNKKVKIIVGNRTYTKTTDSKGLVYVKMPSDKKMVSLKCSFDGGNYFVKSNLTMKLPVYKKTYTKALVHVILKGKWFKILLKGTDGKILKKQKVKFTVNGKNYTRTTNKKGITYLKLDIKRGVYKVKYSYGNNSIYGPSSNSTTLEIIDPSGQHKRGLNQKTSLSVYKYLFGGGHAKITKSIRALAKKITKKYGTKLEKATAIFNYVRDNLDYSYYANSRKGASKTLKTKKGNCCDHANLIVAMCRSVKIPARYSHAQGCKFGSGSVEGHVWAQIYVGKKWYSADATSYRNSLGHIVNWDTKHYYSFHTYRNIPF